MGQRYSRREVDDEIKPWYLTGRQKCEKNDSMNFQFGNNHGVINIYQGKKRKKILDTILKRKREGSKVITFDFEDSYSDNDFEDQKKCKFVDASLEKFPEPVVDSNELCQEITRSMCDLSSVEQTPENEKFLRLQEVNDENNSIQINDLKETEFKEQFESSDKKFEEESVLSCKQYSVNKSTEFDMSRSSKNGKQSPESGLGFDSILTERQFRTTEGTESIYAKVSENMNIPSCDFFLSDTNAKGFRRPSSEHESVGFISLSRSVRDTSYENTSTTMSWQLSSSSFSSIETDKDSLLPNVQLVKQGKAQLSVTEISKESKAGCDNCNLSKRTMVNTSCQTNEEKPTVQNAVPENIFENSVSDSGFESITVCSIQVKSSQENTRTNSEVLEEQDEGNESNTEEGECPALADGNCKEEDTDCLEIGMVEMFQRIMITNKDLTVTLRDCSFMSYIDFITLNPAMCTTVNSLQLLVIDMKNDAQLFALFDIERSFWQITVKSMIPEINKKSVEAKILMLLKHDLFVFEKKSDHSVCIDQDNIGGDLDTVHGNVEKNVNEVCMKSRSDSLFLRSNKVVCGHTCILLETNEELLSSMDETKKNNFVSKTKIISESTLKILEQRNDHTRKWLSRKECNFEENLADGNNVTGEGNRDNDSQSSGCNCYFLEGDVSRNSKAKTQNENKTVTDTQSFAFIKNENKTGLEKEKIDVQFTSKMHQSSSKVLIQKNDRKAVDSENRCLYKIQVEEPEDFRKDKVISKTEINEQQKFRKLAVRAKRIRKGTHKTSPSEKMLHEYSSDSSLEVKGPMKLNACFYCSRSLDIPNRRCKHHKKIRKPVGELNDLEPVEGCDNLSLYSSHDYYGKRLIFRQLSSFDSGISSCSAASSSFRKSLQCRYTHQKAKEVKSRKSSLTKLRCIGYKIGKYRNAIRDACARERERQIAKEIAREIHVDHRNLPVFGLGSYFDRLNNGPPPTTQERMQYEWLRLATFHNYTGNGNALALARNGFYHDHTEGPTTTRCYLCDARHSNWEMFDDVNAEHRRQSPNCPLHENSGQESVNISITSGDNEGRASVQARNSAPTVTSVNTTVTASSSAAAANEAMRSLQIGQASSSGGESISQQPTEDPESRDRSLLALSQPRTQRALGRTGHSYSTIIAPRRNNVATGARSNVGIDPLGSGSTTSNTGSQVPGIRPSSILGGPVGAGAFAGLNRAGQNTDAQPSVARATEGLQQSNAPSSSTEAAAGTRQTNPAPGAGGRTDPTITVVVDNPKHPDYVNIDSRVSSYQGWPDYLDQTPRQMSEAGFFFVGVADFTRCFCCGGGLRNWEPGDDPMLEHTRWFPRCEYVNKLKGERYVAAVQRRHQEHMAEQQRQQIEIAQRRDENRNPPDPMTTEAAAVMREMGYSAERTREAILAVRQQTGSAMVTTQQVLTWLLDAEERRLTGNSSNTELGIRPPPMSSSTATSIVDTSTPSSIVYTGTSISSSVVYTGTSIDTSVVNTTSSISSATSIVSAGTTTSTVSSTSTTATAEVQQTGTPAGAESSGNGNQQTGSGNSSSSNSGSGASVEKQSGASGRDSDESKSAAKEDASSSVPTNKTTKKKNAKKKAKNKAAAKSETAGATGGDIDAKSLKAENEKLREMQTCKICMERAVNTTLLPCGHLVCCDTCAARLQRCPICRKRIKGTVKTFMS